MKHHPKKRFWLRTITGTLMVMCGLFFLLVGYYVRFVLQWKHSDSFSVVNVLIGVLIVVRGGQYLRD